MQHRKLTTMLAILAASAGFSALAGSAHAAEYQKSYFYLDRDPDAEVTLMQGYLTKSWDDGIVSAEVTGDMGVVSGDDAHYRVRVDSFDLADEPIGTTYYDPRPKGFRNDGEHHFAVDMAATPAADLGYVEIALEKSRDGGVTWTEKDHETLPVGRYPRSDDVQILASGIDLGGYGFDPVAHAPLNPGKVSWHIEDDGDMTATADVTTDLESTFFGTSVRVRILALNDNNMVLKTVDGPEHHLQTPAFDHFDDSLSVTSTRGSKLKVKLQEYDAYNKAWIDIAGAGQTVSVAE